MAYRCIWIQRGTNSGDVHISELGFNAVDEARNAVCVSCGTEVGRLIGKQWYERIRSRRGGDRYAAASPAFFEQLGHETVSDITALVEEKVRTRKA